jgi:hypothetical protein
MSAAAHKYCLDANVLIQAWQKYYSPRFCPDYWNVLNALGDKGIVQIPEAVFEEIVRTEPEWIDDCFDERVAFDLPEFTNVITKLL